MENYIANSERQKLIVVLREMLNSSALHGSEMSVPISGFTLLCGLLGISHEDLYPKEPVHRRLKLKEYRRFNPTKTI